MKKNRKNLLVSVFFLMAFVLWTILISFVDVKPIGPNGSAVGLSALNAAFHKLIGVHMMLYHMTDWLGLVPVVFVIGFGLVGLIQWIKRKHILKVEHSILVLGGFYILIFAVYALFEVVVVNYRPVLIEGCLEASYPSSTTMLAMCVMPTAAMQLGRQIKNRKFRTAVILTISAFTVFMVVGRLISGVHWLTDIVGGALISTTLVMLYRWACRLK